MVKNAFFDHNSEAGGYVFLNFLRVINFLCINVWLEKIEIDNHAWISLVRGSYEHVYYIQILHGKDYLVK